MFILVESYKCGPEGPYGDHLVQLSSLRRPISTTIPGQLWLPVAFLLAELRNPPRGKKIPPPLSETSSSAALTLY